MKTVASIAGIKSIDESDVNLIPVFLHDILVEIRTVTIERMIKNLPNYVRHKFAVEANDQELAKITDGLTQFQHLPIEVDTGQYRSVLIEVLNHTHTYIDTGIFIGKIDRIIKSNLQSTEVVAPKKKVTPTKQFILGLRHDMAKDILTEKGLRVFARRMYDQPINDPFKVKYLLDEIRDYFLTSKIDHDEFVDAVQSWDLSFIEAAGLVFDEEICRVLDDHFNHDVDTASKNR